jgi:hypothetical protein
MTILATDDFNRANGGLGANWTTINTLAAPQINGNVVNANAVDSDSAAFYSARAWPVDHWSEIRDATASDDDGNQFITVRVTAGSNTYYLAGHYASSFGANKSFRLQKSTNGVISTLAQITTATITAGDILRLEAKGTGTVALTFKQNGNIILTANDSTSPVNSGSPGIFAATDSGTLANHQLDDWAGGDFALLVDGIIAREYRSIAG